MDWQRKSSFQVEVTFSEKLFQEGESMLGAIAGDIIGSRFEFDNHKSKAFDLFSEESTFTDDTVHTVALAESLLTGTPYPQLLKRYYGYYPSAGYGRNFNNWARSDSLKPYNSYGNGSAMRVSPVGWFFDDLELTLQHARLSASVTHSHPEGIKGAEAVAGAIFLARQGGSRAQVKDFVSRRCGYDLERSLDEIRPEYTFHVSCQGSVPEAIIAFLEGEDFEDTIRNAVSIGGDSDTIACIAGGIAEAFYGGVPSAIADQAWARLDDRLQGVTRRFLEAVMGDEGRSKNRVTRQV